MPTTDSRGNQIFPSIGFGLDAMKAGHLGGSNAEPSIWEVEMEGCWKEERLSRLIQRHNQFSLLATHIRTLGHKDTMMVSYASNGQVKAIRVGVFEYRTRYKKNIKERVYMR